jgi:hypothetical protein
MSADLTAEIRGAYEHRRPVGATDPNSNTEPSYPREIVTMSSPTDQIADDDQHEQDEHTETAAETVWRVVIEVYTETKSDGFKIGTVAAKALTRLAEAEPEALDEWQAEVAERALREMLHARLLSERRSRHQARRAVFAGAAVAHENGDTSAFDALFDKPFPVDDDGHWLPANEMTGKQHGFVANRYEASSKRDALEAAFHRAVQKRCGDRKVGDVLDSAMYTELYRSIVGS